MQEWVDTLRQKLREMKILSPKENLYSKLPEIRAPLLPTRDPTSPLPAPPPVPAALVPGIERLPTSSSSTATPPTTQAATTSSSSSINVAPSTTRLEPSDVVPNITANTSQSQHPPSTTSIVTNSALLPSSSGGSSSATPAPPAMSNTLTQNLINMLSNPVLAYNNQVSNISSDASSVSLEDSFFCEDDDEMAGVAAFPVAGPSGVVATKETCSGSESTSSSSKVKKELFQGTSNDGMSLAKTFSNNVLADPNTCPGSSDPAQDRLRTDATSNENIDNGNLKNVV